MNGDLVTQLKLYGRVAPEGAQIAMQKAVLEIERLRANNSSFASAAICHGDRRSGLLTCPNAPCDNCLQWQRQRAERAEADAAAVRELMNAYNLGGWTDAVAPMKRALAAEAERDALRALVGTVRDIAGCELRNVSDVDVETHSREIGAQFDALQAERDALRALLADIRAEGRITGDIAVRLIAALREGEK